MNDRSSHRARVLRYGEEAGVRVDDQLAAEEPLEIRVGGTPLTVMMRTPGYERELALGFLYGEGVIRGAADVAHMAILPNGEHPDLENVIDVELAPGAPGVDRRWNGISWRRPAADCAASAASRRSTSRRHPCRTTAS